MFRKRKGRKAVGRFIRLLAYHIMWKNIKNIKLLYKILQKTENSYAVHNPPLNNIYFGSSPVWMGLLNNKCSGVRNTGIHSLCNLSPLYRSLPFKWSSLQKRSTKEYWYTLVIRHFCVKLLTAETLRLPIRILCSTCSSRNSEIEQNSISYWNADITTISSLHVDRLTFVIVGVTTVLNLVFLTNSLQRNCNFTLDEW
jgi:hypothetical protein